MSISTIIETSGRVESTYLADGKIVRLSGSVGDTELIALRLALLMPLAEGCRDVVIDAGEVAQITDEAVAILVAARDWAEFGGGRLMLSRSAAALDRVLEELALTEALPRLPALGRVPAQRSPVR